jgi:lysozyme family protein
MDNLVFLEALKRTLEHEGGYVNNPKDKGGETYRGITRKNWPTWKGWAIVDKNKPLKTGQLIKDIELDKLIQDFYFKNFWTPIKADELHYWVAYALFDCAVMQGQKTAIKTLQRALNKYTNKGQFSKPVFSLKVDGIIGPKTIAAANECEPTELVNLIAQERLKTVQDIVNANPSQAGFLMGWTNRIKKFIQTIAQPSNIGLYLVAALILFFLIGSKKK